MTATNPEIKSALMSRGIWPDFVRLREDEKLAHGGTSRTQTIAALEKIAPDLVDLVRPRGRPRGNPPSNPLKAENGAPAENAAAEPAPELRGTPPSPPQTLGDVKRAAKDRRMGGASGVGRVSRSVFANKNCSNMTSLIWAVESLAFSDVAAEDAPSALAWSLYSLMMESPSSKADIVKVTAAKIAQKASIEEDDGGLFDGEGEYSILEAVANGGGE